MKFIFTFLFLSIFNFVLSSQNIHYSNNDLGIQFNYKNESYSPFRTESIDSCTAKDINQWQKYESVNLAILFRYPSNLSIKDEWINGRIELGFKNYLDDSVFYPIITITKTNKEFNRIINLDFYPTYGPKRFIKDTTNKNISWKIVGAQGIENAIYFEGFNCKGLRGESTRRIYTCEEYAYSGYINFYLTFLLIEEANESNIVLTFYNGLLEECVNDKGTPKTDICEDTFFKIASTLELLNK